MCLPFTQGIFVFSLVWSVGASCNDSGRVKFDAVVREVLNGPLSEQTQACHGILAKVEAPPKQLTVPLPTDGTVYQYRFIKEVGLSLITGELRALIYYLECGLKKQCDIYDLHFNGLLLEKYGGILVVVCSILS